MWKKVPQKLVHNLLANFSLNDRPIHYITADIVDDCAVITNSCTYQRIPGCTATTMVAGSHKGMFPSRQSHGYNVHKFTDVGIVEVDNITIAWPKKKIDKRSPPVAELTDYRTKDSNLVSHLKSIHVSSYKAIYNVLQPNVRYTVVAAGMATYRKELYHRVRSQSSWWRIVPTYVEFLEKTISWKRYEGRDC